MTVKELKGKINQFPDNLIVMIPNNDVHQLSNYIWHIPASCVARGVNEADGCVFIDVCEDDDED